MSLPPVGHTESLSNTLIVQMLILMSKITLTFPAMVEEGEGEEMNILCFLKASLKSIYIKYTA